MEALRRIKPPGNHEPDTGQGHGSQGHHEQQAQPRRRDQSHAPQRREAQEDQTLPDGQRRPAYDLAGHQAPTRQGGHQHGLQEPFLAVFDQRNRGEDRGEQQDQHECSGDEVLTKL